MTVPPARGEVPPTAADAHDRAVERGEDTYVDPRTGYAVFTSVALLANGSCCNSGCRHCPYGGDVRDE